MLMNSQSWTLLGLSLLIGACFVGDFVQGMPCEPDDDCGPTLACIEGLCGGPGATSLCGNWLLDEGEACDDGNLLDGDDCTPACRLPVCGDGFIASGEDCDDGNTIEDDDCTSDCRATEKCGNGVVDPGEDCDDGNDFDNDDCTSTCRTPGCGDGIVTAPEECDVGDENKEDGSCTHICTLAFCHDGFVHQLEECDDGNTLDNDDCVGECVKAVCGDGFEHEGVEECDDGNDDDSDSCTTACSAPSCSDHLHSGDETDVDCGGSCGSTCGIEKTCSTDDDCAAHKCVDGVCVEIGLEIVTGGNHTCLRMNSGVRCWGLGEWGQLGYGNTNTVGVSQRPNKAGLVDVGGEVVQLAAGVEHTCALLADGSVRCWGRNDSGQLGYGNSAEVLAVGDDEPPKDLGPLSLGGIATQITTSHYHTCALLDDQTIRCWGQRPNNQYYGELGYGNLDIIGDDETPEDAGPVDVGGAVIQLAAGWSFTCALLDDHTVRCWGQNNKGQLGLGHTNQIGDDELPSSVGPLALPNTVNKVAVGSLHACALMQGLVRCWGFYGYLGVLSENSMGDDETLVNLNAIDLGVPALAEDIETGHSGSCVVLEGGALRCWGNNDDGQLGYWNDDPILTVVSPTADVEVGGAVQQLSMGKSHTCALMVGGTVRCWGSGSNGKLGYGPPWGAQSIGDDEAPASVGDVPCLLPDPGP